MNRVDARFRGWRLWGSRFAALLLLCATSIPRAASASIAPLPPAPLYQGIDGDDTSAEGATEALPESVFSSRLGTTGAPPETTWFGGTVWDAGSQRWEAIPGGLWTFDSGVGSSLVTSPGGPKPVGYHRTFEGWTELDMIDPNDSPPWRRTDICAISGAYSAWLGRTEAEAQDHCFTSGQGYGPYWTSVLSKTFTYPVTGSVGVTLEFDMHKEATGDKLRVMYDPDGTATRLGDCQYVSNGSFSGSGTSHVTLVFYPRDTPGAFRILFVGLTDGSGDDFDGGRPTTCGLVAIDNITLGGVVTDVSDFETSLNGWDPSLDLAGGGLWGDLMALSSLPPLADCAINYGACSMADSVLLFREPGPYGWWHDQFEIAASPWIDLEAAGLDLVTGLVIEYANAWPTDGFQGGYPIQLVQWAGCAGGGLSEWVPIGIRNGSSITTSNCSVASRPNLGTKMLPNMAGARMVRIGLGFFFDCGVGCEIFYEPTPWYDNVRVGITSASAPFVSPGFLFIDAFAQDGTLNPASTARVDNTLDTLTCYGGGSNSEVRVNFRIRPGPYTDGAALAAWAGLKWTAASDIGPSWWTARMDTAETAGVPSPWLYMSTLHESDPKFGGGTDRDKGGDGDPDQLAHDIFPDHLLTPGGRIDYFFSTRYLPPDPRNPAGDVWMVSPDTTGGNYLEMEVLPSSMTADTTWNCVLFVQRHSSSSEAADIRLENETLRQALGGGGTNAEATRFDRLDGVLDRSGTNRTGATAAQAAAYGTIMSSDKSAALSPQFLSDWLDSSTPARPRRIWMAGPDLPLLDQDSSGQALLRQKFGARKGADSYYTPGTCQSLINAAGADVSPAAGAVYRRISCSMLNIRYLTIDPAAAATAKAMTLHGAAGPILSVTNHNPAAGWRTVIDAFALGRVRSTGTNCASTVSAYERTSAILAWFGQPDGGSCTPAGVSGAADPPPPPIAHMPGQLTLDRVIHRPGDAAWQLAFELPGAASATLRLFDVAGREVATLLAGEPLAAGRHALTWDGRTTRGARVTPGIYILRLGTAAGVRTQKIVVRPG